ncbi:hypothetical protein SELMODRAFT_132165, partial [Selaginella moellendorffii]
FLKGRLIEFIAGSHYLRSLVSKERRRLVLGGYNLDMSYITDRLVAMSFPAEDMTAMYRNPMWQVQRALDVKHGSYYKVYNLCVECSYDPGSFHGRVETFPFDDMHVPPLSLIQLFCESVEDWLLQDPRNVAVIHCKAGKGRTGLMVCAYLVYKGMPAEEALQLYGSRRTYNNQGVTIPSQRRYVRYWSKILVFPSDGGVPDVRIPPPKPRELRRIRLYDTNSTDAVKFSIKEIQEEPGELYKSPVEIASGLCEPLKKGFVRTVSPRYYLSFLPKEGDEKSKENQPRFVVQMDTERPNLLKKDCLDHYFDKPICVSGDVRAIFYNKNGGRLFYFCFNTYFISGSMMQLGKGDLDKVTRNGRSIIGQNFCVELIFGPARACNATQNNHHLDCYTL